MFSIQIFTTHKGISISLKSGDKIPNFSIDFYSSLIHIKDSDIMVNISEIVNILTSRIGLNNNSEYKNDFWSMQDLVAKSLITLLVGIAGNFKSTLLLIWAVCITSEKPFCGIPTESGDVLLIIQDGGNPENTIKRIQKYYGERKHNIKILFYENLYLQRSETTSLRKMSNTFIKPNNDKNDIIKRILKELKDNPKIKFVGIDSLLYVLSDLNPNSMIDMSELQQFRQIPEKGVALVILTHLSGQKGYSYEDIMNGVTNPMGSSKIMQLADSVIYTAIKTHDEQFLIKTLGICPKTKRTSPLKRPFEIDVQENKEKTKLGVIFGTVYNKNALSIESETVYKHILETKPLTHQEIRQMMVEKYSIKEIRSGISGLLDSGFIKEVDLKSYLRTGKPLPEKREVVNTID